MNFMKSLKEIVNSSARKIVLTGALAGTTMFGASGCGALPGLPMYLNLSGEENPIKFGSLQTTNGGKYIGEYFLGIYNLSEGKKPCYFHGRGTLYDDKGRIIRDGFWNRNYPVDKDPLEETRKK